MWTSRRGAGREPGYEDSYVELKKPPLQRRRPSPRGLTDRQVRTRSLAWLYPLLSTSLLREFSPRVLRGVSDLVLRAAAQRHSIAQARHRSRRGVPKRHGQRVLEHLDRRKTQRGLTLALRKQVAPYLPHHPVDVALDFHEIPNYGKPIDPKHPQFVKTKEERGTHRAYRYATLS